MEHDATGTHIIDIKVISNYYYNFKSANTEARMEIQSQSSGLSNMQRFEVEEIVLSDKDQKKEVFRKSSTQYNLSDQKSEMYEIRKKRL